MQLKLIRAVFTQMDDTDVKVLAAPCLAAALEVIQGEGIFDRLEQISVLGDVEVVGV